MCRIMSGRKISFQIICIAFGNHCTKYFVFMIRKLYSSNKIHYIHKLEGKSRNLSIILAILGKKRHPPI